MEKINDLSWILYGLCTEDFYRGGHLSRDLTGEFGSTFAKVLPSQAGALIRLIVQLNKMVWEERILTLLQPPAARVVLITMDSEGILF